MLRRSNEPQRTLSSRVFLLLAFGVLIFNLLFLLPLMNTPFLGDDSWCESTIRGFLELTNTSLGELCWAVEKDYIKGGRWYPLVAYYYPLFYYLDREAYKALIIILILFNIVQYGALVKSITRSNSMAIMAMLMPPLFFQFRLYHDPILSYYGLMQVETALILGSLSCFVKYLQTEKSRWLTGSSVLYGVNLLTYEAFYGVVVAHALLAYHQWGKLISRKMMKALIPFMALAAANLMITMLLRFMYPVQYEGNRLTLDLWSWGLAFAKQAFGALPLSYFATFSETASTVLSAMSPLAVGFICISLVVLFLCVFRFPNAPKRAYVEPHSLKILGILGITLWLAPCIIVSGAAKYQQELKWGIAYLPVYVSYFGVMMLALAAIKLLSERLIPFPHFRGVVFVAFAALGAGIFAVNYATNLYVVNAYRNAELRPRLLLETALKNNLFRSVPQGAYLICGLPIRPWDTPAFFKMFSGLTLQVVRVGAVTMDDQLCTQHVCTAFHWMNQETVPTVFDFQGETHPRSVFAGYIARYDGHQGPILEFKESKAVTGARPDVFYLKYSAEPSQNGLVVCGKVAKLKATNDSIFSVVVRNLFIYVSPQSQDTVQEIKISGRLVNLDALEPAGSFTVEARDLTAIASSPDGTLYRLESTESGCGIEPRSISTSVGHDEDPQKGINRWWGRYNLAGQ